MNSENILCIAKDILRANYCGFTGAQDSHIPAMDRLADDGLVYESAISTGPSTTDSMAIIFSKDLNPLPEAG